MFRSLNNKYKKQHNLADLSRRSFNKGGSTKLRIKILFDSFLPPHQTKLWCRDEQRSSQN